MDKDGFPMATLFIVYTNVIIFFLTIFYPQIFNLLAFTPINMNFHTFFTYMFIHSSIYHLLGNLSVIIILGSYLETLIGRNKFLTVYIVSGGVAAIYDGAIRNFFNVSYSAPLVGASGAILGVATFLATIKPYENIPGVFIIGSLLQFIFFIFPVMNVLDIINQTLITVFIILMIVLFAIRSIPVLFFILIQIISIIWSFLYVVSTSVSYLGHFGGMMAGFLLIFFLPKKD